MKARLRTYQLLHRCIRKCVWM